MSVNVGMNQKRLKLKVLLIMSVIMLPGLVTLVFLTALKQQVV